MNSHDRLDSYLGHLRGLPFVRDVRAASLSQNPGASGESPPWADLALDIETPLGRERYLVDMITSHLSREAAERLIERRLKWPDVLVFAPHVGSDLGDRLADGRVNFVDLAGNCSVRIGETYVARIQGRAAIKVPVQDKGMRAPAYLALLAMVIDPDLARQSTRAIAAAAGNVSPQTVAELRSRLVARGMLLETRRLRAWSPTGRRLGFDMLVQAWSTSVLPYLRVGTFRSRHRDVGEREDALSALLGPGPEWRWGGASAAWRLTGYYRGEESRLYVDALPPGLPARLGLVSDPAGPISIYRSPGTASLQSPVQATVSPMVAYLDLLSSNDDRQRETAREIQMRYLSEME